MTDIKYCPKCKENGILNELIFVMSKNSWYCDNCNIDYEKDGFTEVKK